MKYLVLVPTLKMYENSRTNSHVVGSVKKGMTLVATGVERDPDWLVAVNSAGVQGWVRKVSPDGKTPYLSAQGGIVPAKPPQGILTRGDLYEAYLRAAYFDNPNRKGDYVWGAENHPWDCSGLFHAALTRGAKIADTRVTAEDYRQRMHPIAKPTELGDVAYHIVNGHATHIVMWTRDGYWIEARGAAFGIERHRASTAILRGLKWYRSDKINAALKAAA